MIVVTYTTESGDDGVLGVYSRRLTNAELESFIRDDLGDEEADIGVLTDQYEVAEITTL